MDHTLVVGGTGMLREATLWLAKQTDVVSVIARNQKLLKEIADEASHAKGARIVHPLAIDYTDDQTLHDVVFDALNRYGAIESVVSWIHSSAPKAHRVIADLLNQACASAEKKCRWFDVLGSAAADPARGKEDRVDEFAQWEEIAYHEIVLGFMREGNHSRWLSHSEISAGVIKAVREERKTYVVGQVCPWSLRP